MPVEIKLGDRTAKVEVLENHKGKVKVKIDNKIYDLDILMVEDGVYSIINNNKSINMEMIHGASNRHYHVNTLYRSYDVEIIDAQARYKMMRGGKSEENENAIVLPMPGKVVKILVQKGQSVKKGDVLIVVEAMKMQSEYKAKQDCVVSNIQVKEGQTVDGGQVLIELA